MARLQAYQRLATQRLDIADFLLVYIEEAHPSPTAGSAPTPPTRSRPTSACRTGSAPLSSCSRGPPGAGWWWTPCPTPPTPPTAPTSRGSTSSWTERVVYQGGRGPEGYKIGELRNWLDRYQNRATANGALVIQV
ncbi:unnamed protein product [Staurois parvus]|uniref:Iodothyronine deiodinase n=1 Tax=Staurois parvus TaxID=386267 RepID=A0ABN9HPG1_9NEOB|nr:unnamed protein product [Staurois parvus]